MTHKILTYSLSTTAFLTLDIQHGILDLVPESGKTILPQAKKAVEYAREKKLFLIHVGLGFSKGHPEIPKSQTLFSHVREKNLFVVGSHSASFHPDIFKPEDLIVYKHRISAFSENNLHLILRAKGIRHIIFFGISTSGITLSTLRRAYDLDFECTVIKDCCFDRDPEVHRVLTEKIFPSQASVVDSNTFMSSQFNE